MNASITQETATGTAAAAGKKPKATRKPKAGPRDAHVAPATPTAAKKKPPAKKAPKGARSGSKSATILDLLKRKDGAALKELMKATGWQAHSVRGFLSGTIGKKMGLAVTSTKAENGERTYSIKA